MKDNLPIERNDAEFMSVECSQFRKAQNQLSELRKVWLKFLKTTDGSQPMPSDLHKVSEICQAFLAARQGRVSRTELDALERQAMSLHDIRNALRKAEQIGIAKGKEKAQITAIARSLLGDLPIETISQKTGLSVKDVEALASEEDA